MSRKNSLNKQNQQHRKQPIHLYPFTKGSLGDIRNIYSPIEFMTLQNSHESSPTKNDWQNISPTSMTSKYARLSSKIELLQKNLNRLNGQHESLKDMFLRSSQLIKCLQVYTNLQKLKVKIQQSKTNKYIQQKRYEARSQIVYEDYIKKLSQFKKQIIHPQFQQLKSLQNDIMKSKGNNNEQLTKIYNDSFEIVNKNILSIDEKAIRFLNQVQESVRKQSLELTNKKEVQEIIIEQKRKIYQKITTIKVKIGELKCIVQYEIHLEKQRHLGKNRTQLNNPINKQQPLSNNYKFQLQNLKELTHFVGLQSLDRLTYQLTTIDSNLLSALQQYQSNKLNLSKKSQQSTNNKQNSKSQFQIKVSSIHKSIKNFNHELAGLKSFMKSSQKKLQWIKQKQTQQSLNHSLKIKFENDTQNTDIMESVIDLEEKIGLLEKNLNFLKTNYL